MQLINRLARLFSGCGRPAGASRPRKAHLRLEQLDERLVPAVTFYSANGVTYAYNSDHGGSTRIIREEQPLNMDEGRDGTLFASYTSGATLGGVVSNGVLRYDYGSHVWQQVSYASGPAIALSAAEDNTLFASFGWGTYKHDTNGWLCLEANVATKLAAVSKDFYYAYYNALFATRANFVSGSVLSGFSQIDVGNVANVLEASSSGRLTGSWSDGTWQYFNGSWTRISPEPARDIAVVSNATNTFYASFSYGTFKITNDRYGYPNNWTKVEDQTALQLGADGSGLLGSYPADGIWFWNYGWRELDRTHYAFLIA